MEAEQKAQSRAEILVEQLQMFKSNNGAMASLRKGLSDNLMSEAYPYLMQLSIKMNFDFENDKMRDVIRYISGFFAMHPKHEPERKHFGKCLRELAIQRSSSPSLEDIKDSLATHERYLKRLFNTRDSLGLCKRLGFFIRMLKSFEIPVNYRTLYNDVIFWDEDKKIKWAKAYYSGKEDNNVSN